MDYKSAGVNIEEGNNAVELIKPIGSKLSNIGGFAAFEFPVHKYKKPILVSSTDGGTKLALAIESGNVSTIVLIVLPCV